MSDEKYSGTWLIPDEVEQLTELKPNSYKAQCRCLARMRVPFSPNAIGRPLGERAAVLTSVSYPVKPTIHRELVLEAVLKAVRSRRPRNNLIHSDQETQCRSDAWRRFCKANHLEPSMSRRANCWDNAVAESFFGSLKKERIKKRIYADRQTASLDVSEYIEGFYNPIRRHSHLGGVSPIEFKAAHRHRRSGVH